MAAIALFRGPGHVLCFASPELLALAPERDPIGKPITESFPETEFADAIAVMDDVFRYGITRCLERPFGTLWLAPRWAQGQIVGVASCFLIDPVRVALRPRPTALRLPEAEPAAAR